MLKRGGGFPSLRGSRTVNHFMVHELSKKKETSNDRNVHNPENK